MTSLIGFEYSTSIEKRLNLPLIQPDELRDHLRICEGDEVDEKASRRHLALAIALIEKNTGYVISPRLVEMCFYKFPTDNVLPLPFAPVWDDEQLCRYRELCATCGTKDEECFFACLPECAVTLETWRTDKCGVCAYHPWDCICLDNKSRPATLRIDCCDCWPCDECKKPVRVKFVAGYFCMNQVPPELLEAVLLTAADFFDGLGADEIIKRNEPFWDMIGFAC